MSWKTDGVCSGIYCNATEKSQPIKPWKDSLSQKGTNTGEDQSLPCQWSWTTTCPVYKVVLTVFKLSKTLKTWKRLQNRGISRGFCAQEYKRQPRRCSPMTMMRNNNKRERERNKTDMPLWSDTKSECLSKKKNQNMSTKTLLAYRNL